MKLYSLKRKSNVKIDPRKIRVGIFGLGKMGLPLAVVFGLKGFDVIGADINRETVAAINAGICPVMGEPGMDNLLKKILSKNKFRATSKLKEAAENSDIKIIIVPTFLDNNNVPDMSIVESVSREIGKRLKRGDIVILESTAPPGTTMNLIGKTLEKESGLKLNRDFGVAHCPERTNSGTAIADIQGRVNPKIVGGSDGKTTEVVAKIYEIINKRGVVKVQNTTVAELVKVSEGIYRDVNIALANSLYLICNQFGVNANDVITAANTDAVCHLLRPGPGVGGHCIPVYPYFITSVIKKNTELITAARRINDSMTDHVIELVKSGLRESGKSIAESRILLLGISYRGGVKETRKSPGLKIAQDLSRDCDNLYIYDPMFSREEIKAFGLKPADKLKDFDCILLTANHMEFKNLNWKKISGRSKTKTVIDTVSIVDPVIMKKLDFNLKRIGYA